MKNTPNISRNNPLLEMFVGFAAIVWFIIASLIASAIVYGC